MSSKAIIRDGYIFGVYHDDWVPLFAGLGKMEINKASVLEFDAVTQEWVGYLVPSGKEICRAKLKSEAIRLEVEYLEREVVR